MEEIPAAVTARPKRDQRLRILVRGTNRKYYLVPPQPKFSRPDYYVRFDVPRDARERNPKLPKTVLRSTGTNILMAAKLRGRDIIEGILEGRWDDVEKTKLRTLVATLGDILDRYNPSARAVTPLAARRNRNALEMIIREATGRLNVREDRSSAVLTGKILREWIKRRLDKAGADYVMQERAAITINSTLSQARSVLSPKVGDLYQDIVLPDLTEFRAVRKLTVKADVSYRPLPQSCLDAMEQDARLLKEGRSEIAANAGTTEEQQRQVYLAYLLMSRLGLRNSEVFAARWSWIERFPDGSAQFVIDRRSDFVPKNRRCRRQEIEPALLLEIDRYRALPDAWIIGTVTMTERHHVCYRHLNNWLRVMMPQGRVKCSYELRKHAASIIVSRPESEGGGVAAAANFLGDTIATTEKHYGTYLRRVGGIRRDEISAVA